MAILKAENFDLEFLYYNLNLYNEIEYSFVIKLDGKPFFNPDILSQTAYSVKNEKFIMSDCYDGEDWLQSFFINILQTKKGRTYGTSEPPEWNFEAITWEDLRAEKEKSWEDKTVKTKNEQGEIVDISYFEAVKMFIPLWENDIELKIAFPYEVFDTKEYTTFKISLNTTFLDLAKFLEDFGDEMNRFYDFFGDRIAYLGNGKYEEKEEYKYKGCYSSMGQDMYLIKRCAEWNHQSVDDDMELNLLLEDIGWRNCPVGTARYILDSSITEDLARNIFALAETKLQQEPNEEIRKRLKIAKMAIAISFPHSLTNTQQRNNALQNAAKEDIPEEIYEKNKMFYPQHLRN